jgi:hypothetical protein
MYSVPTSAGGESLVGALVGPVLGPGTALARGEAAGNGELLGSGTSDAGGEQG